MAILNEVYIGRLPEIDEMVTDIHNIREEYKQKGNISILKSAKVFEKHVEDMWGFSAFLFDIYIDNYPNAYTYCVGCCLDMPILKSIEYTNKGYSFVKKSNFAATTKIATSLLSAEEMSDEEILAVLLHEIGHSFTERASMANALMNTYRKSYLIQAIEDVILSILFLCPGQLASSIKFLTRLNSNLDTFITKLNKVTKNIPVLRHVSMTSESVKELISRKITEYISMLTRSSADEDYVKRLQNRLDKEEKNRKEKNYSWNTALGRSNERLSDDFANMYGLGPQLATGLIKMGAPYKYGRLAGSEVSDIQKKADDVIMQIYNIIDVHPGNVDRIFAMIDALEMDYKELKVDQKTKAAMMRDIKALKALVEDLKKNQKLLEEYNNKYMKDTTKKLIKKGNSETQREKEINNRKQINDDWERGRKNKKE